MRLFFRLACHLLPSVPRRLAVLTLAAVLAAAAPVWQAALAQSLTLPPLASRSWLLLDVGANQLIASQAARDRVEPASLTKLMTAYVVFTALRDRKLTLDQVIPISTRAWKTGGSKMFVDPKKPVTVDELLHGMIIQSGNDAAVALAEAVSGSEEAFAGAMNTEGKRLGLTGSHFMNASGLPDPQHYSTAFDLGVIATAIIRDFPDRYALYSVKEYRYSNITQPNRNRLLWLDPNVDGLKTGHTESAGYCLIASARRGDRRMLAVVVNAPSDSVRAQEAQVLLNFGFQAFDTLRVKEKDKPVSALAVWKGKSATVNAGVSGDILVAIPRGTDERIKADLSSQQPLLAPIARGQRVGTLSVTYEGRAIGEYPVVALEEVPVAGIFGRMWDTIRLWIK
jgi:D-alanyl-D-alanine carboxypeptidase (penicillin-binding protein 5/6)